ncbi:FAD-dependent oxidoreductase [Mycobacterium sp. AMU20-3851]|uniref:FAD-dependent oxidoreductase n=1 Tax=Mycobacterium sp. AMU20-3851 TaxID=3122055 RepID=UPI003754DE02
MQRVLIAGLGDTGVLTAVKLARHFEVTGVSAKPGLLSGQELGVRVARPQEWARDYWTGFERFRGLDRVRTVHGTLTGLDLDGRAVSVQCAGDVVREPYDILVISTGVSNGFWRRPHWQTAEEIDADLDAVHRQLAAAGTIAVIGGGAAAVSAAGNLAAALPGTRVGLYYPGEHALPQHHRRVWRRVENRLRRHGVALHPGHRAVLPESHDEITGGPVQWSTGQPAVQADAVIWAVGRVRPNTGWLPADLLDESGFVRVTPQLQVPGHPEVFAIGDVAATDPLRASARSRADGLLARNIRAHAAGRPLRAYNPPGARWGSVLGAQPDGLEVFAPSGQVFRFPAWSVRNVLQPWIVKRGIYRGIRE